MSNVQAANTPVSPYVTTQTVASLDKTNKASNDIAQTVSQAGYQTFATTSAAVVDNSPREYSESGRNDENLPRGVLTHKMPSCSTVGENNRHSPSAPSYWSGQTTEVRFQNPLAAAPLLQQQQHTDRLHFPSDTSSNEITDRYAQSSRVFQGLPAPNNTNIWHNSAAPQRFTENSVDLSQPSFQMSQGYYSSSPVTPEGTFQSPRRSLSNLSHSTSSLPPSSPASDIYPPPSPNTSVTSPHVTVETRHQQSASPAGYFGANSYPQSPQRVPHSPQIQNTDGYMPSPSPVSPSHRVMQGYSTQYPMQSRQVLDRYAQAPACTPDQSSPYSSPPTPDRSSQSPHYSPISPSLPPAYYQTPARAHHIPSGTNELYPTISSYSPTSTNDVRSLPGGYSVPSQSITSYPQSPYEYPRRSPQTPTNPTERYSQPSVSPRTMHQENLSYCRSPESYSQTSPALSPPVRRNEYNDQSLARSSQLTPPEAHNSTHFSVQSDHQHVTNVNDQLQHKKTTEDSLQPCQVKRDIAPTSPNTTPKLSREMLGRNFQSPLMFGSSLEVGALSSDVITNKQNLMQREEHTHQQTKGIHIS